MRIFHENLFFATMGAERLGKLIAYRSNKGKFHLGDNIFELLCLPDTETSYLLRELFSGGETPIVIMSEDGAIIVDRHLLYSTGVCLFIVPDFPADIVCSMLYRETFGACLMSPLALDSAINSKNQDNELLAQAYVSLLGYKSRFSVFSDRVETDKSLDVAHRICEEMSCSLVQTKKSYLGDFESPDASVYSNSLYSLSVLIAAFVSKITSDERTVYIGHSEGRISISVDCKSHLRGMRDVLDHLSALARDRDAEILFDLSDGRLTLDVCPFYADVGLMGVKNPQKLKQD